MGFKALFFLGMIITCGLNAQVFDTIDIKPLDLGLPKSHVEELLFTLADKYGVDSAQWPIWAREKPELEKGMDLDRLEFSALLFNDSLSLRFDDSRPYRVDTLRGNFSERVDILYYQDNLIFVSNDYGKTVDFLSMYRPLKKGFQRLTLFRSDRSYDLSRLDSLKSIFPKSYDWRDGVPSGLTFGFHFSKKDAKDLVVVFIGTNEPGRTIDLHFYKGNLVYIYHSLGNRM